MTGDNAAARAGFEAEDMTGVGMARPDVEMLFVEGIGMGAATGGGGGGGVFGLFFLYFFSS